MGDSMETYDAEIKRITKEIIGKYHPSDIILFGSCAKGTIKSGSDIDICVIMETEDRRQAVRDMLFDLVDDFDVDIVVYTPAEWMKYKDDMAAFAGVINRTGRSLMKKQC